jgi:nicotinate-nucleotide adenylyltransferase
MARRIGILGGTFNPIHHGHLLMAQELAEAWKLEQVLLMPTRVPPHKDAVDLASEDDRLAMARLAAQENPLFEVSDREIRRGGVSYTVLTLRELTAELPGTALHFLIGADSLPDLPKWREAREVVRLAQVLTATRPGCPFDRIAELAGAFPAEDVARLRAGLVETTPIGISSTEVRRRARAGRSLRYLVPAPVAEYIGTRRLYAT